MKSVMTHQFSQVPAPQIQRSVFDRSHGHKTTMEPGWLVPFFVDEVLPGDTMKLHATLFGRLATLVSPIMDNLFMDTFYFFVPNRLVWENWERFNGAQDNPDSTTDFLVPVMGGDPLHFDPESLGDYFGLPSQVDYDADTLPMSLPFRAYNLIWNEWFRDQNLQDKVKVDLDNGPDSIVDYTLLKRGRRHDYFTSCLPWPQKGNSVLLPLGEYAPVIGTEKAIGFTDGTTEFGAYGTTANAFLHANAGTFGLNVGTAVTSPTGTLTEKAIGLSQNYADSGMVADLTAATAATINQLRQAFAFQKVLERDARGGTRYVEFLKAHFQVTSPDFRLQRPEYLGGGSQRINVSSVAQTSGTPASPDYAVAHTPQANLAGFGTVGSQSGFNKSFVEHGFVIGLVNVRSDITYQQGMAAFWSRQTRFDFYLPALANLGEQPVYNREINYQPSPAPLNAIFGYQERWAEYRYKPSIITGKFKSNVPGGGLESWHLGLDFATTIPTLNADFIKDDPPISRIVAVPSEPSILLDTYINIRHARPMPVYSVPGQLDRF